MSAATVDASKRVLLAYSGGLDTSCILQYLLDQGYTVVAYCADVGQEEDFEKLKAKALSVGAEACIVDDLRAEFVREYVIPFCQWAARYEGRYMLGTAIARPCIAKGMVRVAQQHKCGSIAHGATGKGNDQVRFELSVYALAPTIQIIAPWRDGPFTERFKGRNDLLKYAAENNIQVEATTAKPWSMDENLFHCSYEAGVLENAARPYPAGMCKLTKAVRDTPDEPQLVDIYFKSGAPVRVGVRESNSIDFALGEGEVKYSAEATEPLEAFLLLNKVAREHGVGRIDIVENRFVGIKSRGVYETPGGTLLFEAHADLEGLVLDREVRRVRDSLAHEYSRVVYNGLWHSPEMSLLDAVRTKSQESVDGIVCMQVFKGQALAIARSSEKTLYDEKLSSMDEEGGFVPSDSTGFIAINAIRLKAAAARTAKELAVPILMSGEGQVPIT